MSTTGRSRGEIIASVLSSALEWYDFSVFGYFSSVIAKVFFPPEQGNNALIQSLCIYGAAFFARPIGSVMFGYIGDTCGRKVVLTWSTLLMAGATFTIGCLPTYRAIGSPAIILLLLIRLLQGVSVSGQLTSSLLFNMEGKPTNKWAFSSSVIAVSGLVGFLIGSLVGYIVEQNLSPIKLNAWGWRMPFLAGVVLGLPGMYLKYHGDESNTLDKIYGQTDNTRSPLELVFGRENRRAFICALLVSCLGAQSWYLTFVWVPVFMKSLIEPPIEQAYLINSVVLVITSSAVLFVGIISDKYFKRTHLMFVGGTCLAILSPLMIVIISKGNPLHAFLAQLSLSMFSVLWSVTMYAWIAQSFPVNVRLTGMSISYNIALALLGGITPALATVLLDNFGPIGSGLLTTCTACISMLALLMAPPIKDHREVVSTMLKESIAVPLKAGYVEQRELVSYRQVVV